MKKIFKFSFLLVLLLSFSCEDAYNIAPDDEILEENAIRNVDDLQRAILGVYSGVSGSNLIGWSSRFTDDLRLSPENRGQGVSVHGWNVVSGTDEIGGLWNNLYNVNNRATRLLSVIDNIPTISQEEEDIKERIKAECYAIRAMSHFDLLRLFTVDLTDMTSKGVPIIDYIVVFEQPNRNTVGEVFNFVNDELNLAYGMLDESYTNNTRFTKIAIRALQARVALYEGNYSNAISYSTDVIAQSNLANQENYPLIWADASDEEVLFKLARTTGDGAVGTLFRDTNGDTFFNMSSEMLDFINGNGWTTDVRTFVNIDVDNFDAEAPLVGKYLGTAANYGLNDIKLLRTSEQYLIRAEAYARTNQLVLAAADIAFIKTERSMTDTPALINYSSQDVALDGILNERRFELAYEGHRFFDIKRFGEDIERNAEDCVLASGACSLSISSHLFTLPIPQSELFANDNITPNPGYGN